MKKLALTLVVLIALLFVFIVLMWNKPYPGSPVEPQDPGVTDNTIPPAGNTNNDPAISRTRTITGEFACLPHKNDGEYTTLECAYGLKGDDGFYYAMDFSAQATSAFDLPMGRPYKVTGLVTPIEAISADYWQRYDIKGIMKVESFEEVVSGIPAYPVNSVSVFELKKPVTIGGTTFTVFSVYEDSRCPADVTCFQAGRVIIELSAKRATSTVNQRLQPGQEFRTNDLVVTLDSVTPEPVSYRKIEDSQYRFYISVRKR